MGLNDNVYNISKIISAENSRNREEKENQLFWQEKEQELKEQLFSNLVDTLQFEINNIYNNDYKTYIINYTFKNFIKQNNILYEKQKEKMEILKKSITFYYFKICQEAEKYYKNLRKNDVELAKIELQKQKLEFDKQYKLQKLELAANKELAKNKTTTDLSWIAPLLLGIVKISLCVVIAPVFLIGFFFLGFLKAITK